MEQALGDSREFDVVALQEPHRNRTTMSVYCNERYHRIFDEGRVALFVHKRHPVTSWLQQVGRDWCNVTFTINDMDTP